MRCQLVGRPTVLGVMKARHEVTGECESYELVALIVTVFATPLAAQPAHRLEW